MTQPRKPHRVREVAVEPHATTKRPTNLTLSVDALARAEQAALARGTSISQLVDDLLLALPVHHTGESTKDLAPPVRRLLGVAKGKTDASGYHEFLYQKYGADR